MKQFILKSLKFPIAVIFLGFIAYIVITFGISAILAAILPSVDYFQIIEYPGMWLLTFMLGFIGLLIDSNQ